MPAIENREQEMWPEGSSRCRHEEATIPQKTENTSNSRSRSGGILQTENGSPTNFAAPISELDAILAYRK